MLGKSFLGHEIHHAQYRFWQKQRTVAVEGVLSCFAVESTATKPARNDSVKSNKKPATNGMPLTMEGYLAIIHEKVLAKNKGC